MKDDIISLFIQTNGELLTQADEKMPRTAMYKKFINNLQILQLKDKLTTQDIFQLYLTFLIHNEECQELCDLRKYRIERLESRVRKISDEKEEMRELHANEVNNLKHQFSSLKLENEELSKQNKKYVSENANLKNQLERIRSEKDDLPAKHQKHVEENLDFQKRIKKYLDTEIKYRELAGAYYLLKESSHSGGDRPLNN